MNMRINIVWMLIVEFERRTHFFEKLLIRLGLLKTRSFPEEELQEQYDDGDINYAEDIQEGDGILSSRIIIPYHHLIS